MNELDPTQKERNVTVLNRRQFIHAAATAAIATRTADLLAQTVRYDLILKGGRVIDPSLRLDAIRDVAIAGGRIAAVEASIAGDAAETHRCARQDRRAGPDRHPYPRRRASKTARRSAWPTA